ncbi:hypothetical protein [Nocardia salmonicida]|uniref:hypothetical protein n=1 Tax=Nocardia salmonicida TaxID=53431 RepID=UPI0037AA7753
MLTSVAGRDILDPIPLTTKRIRLNEIVDGHGIHRLLGDSKESEAKIVVAQ